MKAVTAGVLDSADRVLREMRRVEDAAEAAVVVPLLEAQFDRRLANGSWMWGPGVIAARHFLSIYDDVDECPACETGLDWTYDVNEDHSWQGPASWAPNDRYWQWPGPDDAIEREFANSLRRSAAAHAEGRQWEGPARDQWADLEGDLPDPPRPPVMWNVAGDRSGIPRSWDALRVRLAPPPASDGCTYSIREDLRGCETRDPAPSPPGTWAEHSDERAALGDALEARSWYRPPTGGLWPGVQYEFVVAPVSRLGATARQSMVTFIRAGDWFYAAVNEPPPDPLQEAVDECLASGSWRRWRDGPPEWTPPPTGRDWTATAPTGGPPQPPPWARPGGGGNVHPRTPPPARGTTGGVQRTTRRHR